MTTRHRYTKTSTTLARLRRSRGLACTTLLTTLFSIVGPLVPRAAQAQSNGGTVNPGNGGPAVGAGNTAMQAGQSDMSAPETGGVIGVTGSVDPATGVYHASIPFDLPAARGAAQPTLSLDYSSSGGRGVGGLGWSLSMPAIERHNLSGAPTYEDPALGTRINPQTQDLFTFAGQALVPVCFLPDDYPKCVENVDGAHNGQTTEVIPTWAMSGWHYYRLEVDNGSNLRFFWSPNHQTWVVQRPDGSTMEFGVPQDDPTDTGGIDSDIAATAVLAALTSNTVPLPAIFRYNLVRQYDAERIPGTGHPTNPIEYKWTTLAQPQYPQALPGDAGTPDPAFVSSLTDIYDTPPVGSVPPSLGSFAHHTHLNYIPDPTWLVPDSSPVWRARTAMRLAGVDVTSQTYVGIGAREQVRRYVISYVWDSNEYDLQQVKLDGWCSSGGPTEDTTTYLLPPEAASPACGAGATGRDWPPVTTFGYYSGGAGAYPSPTPTFYKMPNGFYSAGGTLAGTINLPTLLDVNADGMPDVINPALTNGETVSLNSVQPPLNSWTTVPISLLYPSTGVTPGTLGPWSSSYASGSFLNDSHVNVAWFDPSWFDSATAIQSTTAGVAYVTYAPVFSSSSSLDWGAPTTQTLASVFLERQTVRFAENHAARSPRWIASRLTTAA